MAAAGFSLLPSKEKTNFLRLAALIIDGGTLALKTQFDTVFPPLYLGQELQNPANFQIILRLKHKKIISQAQYVLLIPPPFKVADSSDFDITLLSCLIQSLPALGQHNSPVWKQPGPPAPTDFSLAAEVKRLRYFRNNISHLPSATLSDQDFQDKWKETSDIIQRLCVTVPDIQNYIYASMQLSLDPEKEQDLIDKLEEWENFDNRLKNQERQSMAILKRLHEQEGRTDTHEATMINHEVDMQDVKHDVGVVKEDVKCIAAKADRLTTGLEKVEKASEAMQADQETRSKMSSEFRALVSRSKIYFEEEEGNEFVETTTYAKALEILESENIVILSGHPGEGKTTMAKHLLTRFRTDRCINLSEPKDWKHIDFSLNLIDAILIDDIFGSGVLDENLVKNWERKLKDMSKIIKKKYIYVIITSRHYILEETKQLFRSLPLFKNKNIQLLSSKDLTHKEKLNILEAHLKAEKRPVEHTDMTKCVMKHASVPENLLGTNEFLFGFPESVNLFARQDDLFDKGPDFFSQPNSFVKTCIQQLYENEEQFLALTVMWGNKAHILKKSELDESILSNHLLEFKVENKMIKKLRKSLDHHVGGLLHFSRESGTYSFSHNVICDVVGLVVAEENPDEVLAFCTREFMLTYVTTESTDDEFKFCVDKYLFQNLADRLIELMVDETSKVGLLDCSSSITSLNRDGKMESRATPSFSFDFSFVKHESFQNEHFVNVFLDAVVEKGKLESIFGAEVMELSGFFLRYGLKTNEQKDFLLSYSAFIGLEVFAKRVVAKNLLDQTELSNDQKAIEYTMTLLFAVHHQMFSLVEILLQKDVIVTEEVLYIAAHKSDMDILKLLLGKQQNMWKLPNVEILNGNNALIVAAKKGFTKSVRCFIASGYNLTARNKDGFSALDKAIVYRHEDVCKLLVEAGVPLNKATRKFKRRPIHTAIDNGLISATKCLLANGGTLMTRDHKGFYPIHTAALNRHYEIVYFLLEHDPGQANLLTKTYGAKSVLKGKSVFHIALCKKDEKLLDVLLSTKANPNVTDWFGRTVFQESILVGDPKFINKLKGVADMTIPDKDGVTPLHAAVYKGYALLVHTICSNPAVRVNAKDKNGETPLHISAIRGFSEIFLALASKYNADWRMVSKRGDTILHLVVRKRDSLRKRLESQQQDIVNDEIADAVQQTAGNCDKTGKQNDETSEKGVCEAQKSLIEQVSGTESIRTQTGTCATSSSTSETASPGHSQSGYNLTNCVNKQKSDDACQLNPNSGSHKIYSIEAKTRLKPHMIRQLISGSFTNANDPSHIQSSLETNSCQDQDTAITQNICRATLESCNTIIKAFTKFDMEFIKKELTNKYGEKIVFCAET